MSLKQKAIKGVVWSAIESFGRQGISFIVFSILARLLDPESFGLVALASVFLGFMQVFLDQGLSQAIIQRKQLEPEHLNSAFWSNLAISICLTLLTLLSANWIAVIFKQPTLEPIIQWLSLSFILSAFSSIQQAIFSRNLAFKPLAIRSLAAVVVGGLAGITSAFMGFGVWSLVSQQLTSSLAEILVLWWISDWRPKPSLSLKHYQELFVFGIHEVGFNLFNFFTRRGDDLLIGYFLGPIALGYYTIAYRILLVLTQLLTTTTHKVALPIFSKLQSEPARMRNVFYTATQFSSLIAFPIFIGVAVLAPELIILLFGVKWLPSTQVMQVLTFVGLLQSVSYFNGAVLLATGKPDWRLWLTVFNTTANVIAYFLVVRWGILAVACAYVIRGYLCSPIPVLMIRKLIKIEIGVYLQQFMAPLLGTLAMAGVILTAKFLLQNIGLYPIALISICTLLGSLTYLVVIWLAAPKLFQKVREVIVAAMPDKRMNSL